MPLIVNGTTIPTNVANTLKFNGNNVTSVVFNGTTVWQQSLFSGVWSGNSLTSFTFNGITTLSGITTSGSAYRYGSGTQNGAWLYSTSSGLGVGSSLFSYFTGKYQGIVSTATSFALRNDGYAVVGSCGFSTVSKFSGSSLYNGFGFNTSGGLIRYQESSSYYGAFIGLN